MGAFHITSLPQVAYVFGCGDAFEIVLASVYALPYPIPIR